VPILPAARRLAGADVVPGGTLDNLAHVKPHVSYAEGLACLDPIPLADAQTSGGLLISVPQTRVEWLLELLVSHRVDHTAVIGQVDGPGQGRIRVEM
jgi:selenide,water dikinase